MQTDAIHMLKLIFDTKLFLFFRDIILHYIVNEDLKESFFFSLYFITKDFQGHNTIYNISFLLKFIIIIKKIYNLYPNKSRVHRL